MLIWVFPVSSLFRTFLCQYRTTWEKEPTTSLEDIMLERDKGRNILSCFCQFILVTSCGCSFLEKKLWKNVNQQWHGECCFQVRLSPSFCLRTTGRAGPQRIWKKQYRMEVAYDETTNQKKKRIIATWGNLLVVPGVHSQRFGGWSKEDLIWFNQLYAEVDEDRKTAAQMEKS